MAEIIAKTKAWINKQHDDIEKSMPTELIVQENKLYLGHDGTVLAGQEGQPLLQGPKGDKGDDGAPGITPNISASATVNNAVGTPAVSVVKGGTAEAPTFTFNFTNLKGQKGDDGAPGSQGPQGDPGPAGSDGAQGPVGPTPVITATATVDNATGTPSVQVVKGGTDTNPTFAFNFKNLKGAKGDKGDAGAGGGVELYRYAFQGYINGDRPSTNIISFDILSSVNIPDDTVVFTSTRQLIRFLEEITNITTKAINCSGRFNTSVPVDTSGTIIAMSIVDKQLNIIYIQDGGNTRANELSSAGASLSIFAEKFKLLGTTATLATITQDEATGDITISTPENQVQSIQHIVKSIYGLSRRNTTIVVRD